MFCIINLRHNSAYVAPPAAGPAERSLLLPFPPALFSLLFALLPSLPALSLALTRVFSSPRPCMLYSDYAVLFFINGLFAGAHDERIVEKMVSF